jgi:transcriptional regulator with XRE-family HTH domain
VQDNGRLPFNIVLRRAMSARGLSLARVAERLAVAGTPLSISTLSSWQRGATTPKAGPSLRAVTQLEAILELPAGGLSSSLRPYADGLAPIPTRRGTDVFHAGRLRAGLDTTPDDLEMVRLDEHVTIRPHQLRATIQMTLRAKRTGVDRTVILVHPEVASNAVITAGPTCRLGAIRRHDPSGLVAAELRFATALTRGELYPVTYETVSPRAEQTGYLAASVRPGLASFSLTVEFDMDVVPTHVYQVWRQTADSPHKRIADLRLMDGRWAHVWLRDPPPGTHGVRWDSKSAGTERFDAP